MRGITGQGKTFAFPQAIFFCENCVWGGVTYPILLLHMEYLCTWSSIMEITLPSMIFAQGNAWGSTSSPMEIPPPASNCCVAVGNISWGGELIPNSLKTVTIHYSCNSKFECLLAFIRQQLFYLILLLKNERVALWEMLSSTLVPGQQLLSVGLLT